VLARSLGTGFHRDNQGVPSNAAALYGSYDFRPPAGGGLRLFFRDHYLSDLVGFVYSHMDPRQAAGDLLERLRRCGRAALAAVPDPVISVILDGENAWEYYSRNGRDFFRALYQGLSSDPELQAVTFGQALELAPHGQLAHVVPGSWINANFDIWIGAPEDNRSWSLLREARDFFGRVGQQGATPVGPECLELAREELLIAEGSDWNWWYGPEHHTANDRQFDELYRAHLANVYRALAASPPESLALPVAIYELPAFSAPPRSHISPRLDGLVSSYFEWLGAGIYSLEQRTSTMHGKRFYLNELYYGVDERNFYLRLDLTSEGCEALKRMELQVNLTAGKLHSRLSARLDEAARGGRQRLRVELLRKRDEDVPVTPTPVAWAPAPGDAEACFYRILELRASLEAIGMAEFDRFRFQVVLWESGLPMDVLPLEGWLEVDRTPPAL